MLSQREEYEKYSHPNRENESKISETISKNNKLNANKIF